MHDPAVSRVCAAGISERTILMVRHVHHGRNYWTLPGGVERGETAEQAALRELREEANLTAAIVCPLYERRYRSTTGRDVVERCFLLQPDGEPRPTLGHDPELDARSQLLTELAWRALDELREDLQVARVLAALAEG